VSPGGGPFLGAERAGNQSRKEIVRFDQLNHFLLRKQHLTADSRGQDVLQVVQDLCALHATATATPYVSLWSRLTDFRQGQLDAELYENRALVRLLCMRATLHIVPAGQMVTFFQATRSCQRRDPRILQQLLLQTGLCREDEEEQTLQRLLQRVVEVAAEQGPSTVTELTARIPELAAKFSYAVDKPYGGELTLASQLVPWMCSEGWLVRARPRGSWRSNLYEYAVLASWLPGMDLQAQTPDEARIQLFRCYLAALGPATLEDMVWWSGLGKGQVKKALLTLHNEVAELEIEGNDGYWILRADLDGLGQDEPAHEPLVSLLPSLDPYIMGYRDRRRFLPPEHYDQVFDRSGNAFATVWVNGQVVGIWQQREESLELLLWEHVHTEALLAEARRLLHFLTGSDGPVTIQSYPPELYVKTPFSLGRRP